MSPAADGGARGFAVGFEDLGRWDIKSAMAALFRHRYAGFVPFGNFVEECTETVRPSDDPLKEWPVYGVNNKDGVFFSHHQLGEDFNTAYKIIKPDWFFHNPTRANVGSLGRVPKVESDAITSPEYQVWRIKNPEWLPEYVAILIRMPFFNELIQVHRVGAVKERLYAQNLLEIPVPSHGKRFQQAIVAKWKEGQARIDGARAEAQRLINDSETDLLKDIGVDLRNPCAQRGAFALNLEQIDRWDTFFYRSDFVDLDKQLLALGAVPLNQIAHLSSRSWKPADFPTGTFQYVEISSVTKEDGIVGSRTVDVPAAPSRATTLLREGDLIVSTTRPYLGAFAKVTKPYDGAVCSSGFCLIDTVDENRAEKDFLLFFLKSGAGLRQMERRMTGGLYPAITQDELAKVLIVLPAPEKQKEVVQRMSERESLANSLVAKAGAMEKELVAEIEAMILGEKGVKP